MAARSIKAKITLEEAMTRLEEILRTMDDGKVSLEESLSLFEEGTALVRFCSKTLEEAKLRVKEVAAQPGAQTLEGKQDE